ncbi:DUF368 domain-containing protein [Lacticaseibacillus mingshuiensis]|uniref:DUF368 domain-containing protein n=1 Tax=Lacticaseibacillus mingshuiensis TaxID=2799574 RepID=A0ABW4CFS9_9LACO|nr:DUF368 domain-containing protein [Lacticaseibacillus mingshuiensis]
MLNFIKGILIGVALVIPGLSGSIFAVVVGLYDQLIEAVSELRREPRRHLLFLLPIAAGAVLGVLLSTKLTLVVTARWPLASYAFFIGLMLGAAPFIRRKMALVRWRPQYLLLTVLGFGVIYGLAQLGGASSTELVTIARLSRIQDAGMMAFAGLFSVSLMAIPGVSGAIMLMVINQYGTVYNAVSQLGDAARALLRGNWAAMGTALQSSALLIPFMVGALIGLLAIAKLMRSLLHRFEGQVYYAVCGVVLAAVVILIQTGLTPHWPSGWLAPIALCLISAGVGIAATLVLDKPE